MAPYIEQAKQGGVIIVPPLKAKLEKAFGRSLAQSTVYTLLHRHGWRKLSPDKQHPQSDPVAQHSLQKNSPKKSTKQNGASTGPRR